MEETVQAAATSVDGTSTLTSDPRALPTLGVVPKQAALGGAVTADIAGEPGALTFLYAALDQHPPLLLPGFFGVFLIGSAAIPPILVGSATLDGTGLGIVAFLLPTDPLLLGATPQVQAVALTPFAAFTNPGLIAITQ